MTSPDARPSGAALLLGVEDKSRRVRGVADPLALEVHPSPSRPHYLTRKSLDGGTYVRVGSTNRLADAELIGKLGRFARGEAFVEQPMPGLDSEAIDFRAASESFAAVRKLARRDLVTLRLVTRHQGRKVATVGGMILFGKDRERHFPDAWIQAGRFGGTDKSRIADRTEIHALPVQAVEEAIAFVHTHTLHGAEIGSVRRKERWSLPPVAVREAVFRKRGEHRFQIPDGARWGDVKAASVNLGEVLTRAMRAVADANDVELVGPPAQGRADNEQPDPIDRGSLLASGLCGISLTVSTVCCS